MVFVGLDKNKPALRTEGLLPATTIMDIIKNQLMDGQPIDVAPSEQRGLTCMPPQESWMFGSRSRLSLTPESPRGCRDKTPYMKPTWVLAGNRSRPPSPYAASADDLMGFSSFTSTSFNQIQGKERRYL